MCKMTCILAAMMVATAVTAVEQQQQPSGDDNLLSISVQKLRSPRSVQNTDWLSRTWNPEAARPLNQERWIIQNAMEDPVHESQDASGQSALWFEQRENMDGGLGGNPEEAEKESMLELAHDKKGSSMVAKRQLPKRLGSLVDLYKELFQGLSPYVADSGTQILPARPERRSGRRPAACRFGPFELVCWNAARRGAVIRTRSTRYSQ